MAIISVRANEEDSKLIHEYVAANKLNMSQFIREAVLDKIEDDLNLDEERIVRALKAAEGEKSTTIRKCGRCLGYDSCTESVFLNLLLSS